METRKEGPKEVRQSDVRGEFAIVGVFPPGVSGFVPSTKDRAVFWSVVYSCGVASADFGFVVDCDCGRRRNIVKVMADVEIRDDLQVWKLD